MSHLQGSDYVGSMVVMEDGLTKRGDYRRFKVTGVPGQRRLRGDGGGAHAARLRSRSPSRTGAGGRRARRDPTNGRRSRTGGPRAPTGAAAQPRFAYPPQLLLLDGGKGQLGVGVPGAR